MEIYIIPLEDKGDEKFIIYRPLLGLAFVGNRAMAELARGCSRSSPESLNSKALEFLQRIGFFTADPPEPLLPNTEFAPTTLALLVTNQCQLRCRYCYAAAGESPPRQIPLEAAFAAVDYVSQNAMERGEAYFEVSFHGGGEPTLAWTTLLDVTKYARQKPVPSKITLTSNGMWSKSQLAWILNNVDGLTLSLDGTPTTQNRLRPFTSGRGSAEKIMKSVAELDKHNFPYGIRMTVVAPWEELPQNVQFLCENTYCQAIQVEPTFNTTRGGHGEATNDEALAFGRAFLDAQKIARRLGKYVYYSGARLEKQISTFCFAPFQSLIVDIMGNLVTCYEVTDPNHPFYPLSQIGRIDVSLQSVHVDQNKRQKLLERISQRRASCKDCFCYWTCAGDCYVRAFVPGADGHLVRGPRCTLNRFLTKELLLDGIAQGGGVWRQNTGRTLSFFSPLEE